MEPKYLNRFLLLPAIFLLIIACDPCDDCNIVSSEPTISLVFINQDSISILEDSLAVFSFNDSSLTANIDSLTILRDSLRIVNDSIQNGGSLNSEKDALEQWISERQADSIMFTTKNEHADALTIVFNEIRSRINSGLVQVNQIEILGTSFIDTYEDIDSATNWSIPLSYDKSFTQYQVDISDFSEVIEFDYDVIQEVDKERNVLIRAENIRIVDKMYEKIDSVKSNCENNCLDGEATFTFYF